MGEEKDGERFPERKEGDSTNQTERWIEEGGGGTKQAEEGGGKDLHLSGTKGRPTRERKGRRRRNYFLLLLRRGGDSPPLVEKVVDLTLDKGGKKGTLIYGRSPTLAMNGGSKPEREGGKKD